MAAIRQETDPQRRPSIVPQLPYQDIAAALAFLERAFGFREIPTARRVSAAGVIGHSLVEFGDSVIGIGTQGAHHAVSPKSGGGESQYLSVYINEIETHYERARAAGAEIASELRPHVAGRTHRVYEALDPEGHRWRFVQFMPEVPQG